MKKTMSLILFAILLINFACEKEDKKDEIVEQESYYETFDSLNTKKWIPELYSFEGNGANMIAENITITESILEFKTSINQDSKLPQKYNGCGMGDVDFNMYGYFEVRMKPEIISGTVGSFFLMNQWVANDWEHQEIDIEFIGNKLTSMQMTTHHYQDGGKNHKYSSTVKDLGFDITKDFHNYGILWTPDSVSWYVDGNLFHTEKEYVPQVPLQIRLNHWPGNMSEENMVAWLGAINDNELPSKVFYDWIKVMSIEEFKEKYLK